MGGDKSLVASKPHFLSHNLVNALSILFSIMLRKGGRESGESLTELKMEKKRKNKIKRNKNL